METSVKEEDAEIDILGLAHPMSWHLQKVPLYFKKDEAPEILRRKRRFSREL